MSKYTTGEVAKLCGVSVRTVQYYDSRNILVPSALSEGGRRLYDDVDLKRMQIICFLREMGFSLDNIGELFAEKEPEKMISLLVDQQREALETQLQQCQEKLEKLDMLKRGLRSIKNFSVDSLGDIAYLMKNRKKRRRMLIWMLALGLVMDAIEIGTVAYGFVTGTWWPVAVGLPIVIGLGVFISRYYFCHVAYICPQCHHIFHPKFRDALWASHTPNTRRLTCPQCGHRGFCVETYRKETPKC